MVLSRTTLPQDLRGACNRGRGVLRNSALRSHSDGAHRANISKPSPSAPGQVNPAIAEKKNQRLVAALDSLIDTIKKTGEKRLPVPVKAYLSRCEGQCAVQKLKDDLSQNSRDAIYFIRHAYRLAGYGELDKVADETHSRHFLEKFLQALDLCQENVTYVKYLALPKLRPMFPKIEVVREKLKERDIPRAEFDNLFATLCDADSQPNIMYAELRPDMGAPSGAEAAERSDGASASAAADFVSVSGLHRLRAEERSIRNEADQGIIFALRDVSKNPSIFTISTSHRGAHPNDRTMDTEVMLIQRLTDYAIERGVNKSTPYKMVMHSRYPVCASCGPALFEFMKQCHDPKSNLRITKLDFYSHKSTF